MNPTDLECSSAVQLLPGMCQDLGAIPSNRLPKRDQYRTFYGKYFWFGLVLGFVVVLSVRFFGGQFLIFLFVSFCL